MSKLKKILATETGDLYVAVDVVFRQIALLEKRSRSESKP